MNKRDFLKLTGAASLAHAAGASLAAGGPNFDNLAASATDSYKLADDFWITTQPFPA